MNRVHAILCYLLLASACVLSAKAQGTYIPTLYNTSNGLPQQTVNATIQDKQGYMWFATSNGFSRFDGEHFTNYRLEDSDSIGLGNNLITSLREDSRRYIWLTNDDRKIFRFNPYTRQYFKLPESLERVKSLQLIPNGDIWLYLEDRQLVRAFYDDDETLHYERILAYPPDDDTDLVMVSNDREGRVWILTNKEFLDYHDAQKKLTRHPIDDKARFFSMRKRLNLFQLGSDHGKVYIYHNKEDYHTLIQLPTEDNIVRIKAYTNVKSIYMTGSDGFFLHDIETGEARHYSATQPSPCRLESNRIGDCYVDQDKNIWVTYLDNSVITCLEINRNTLRKFHLLDRHHRNIETRNKISIFEDRNERIWFYAPNKALNYYDMENHKLFPLVLPATQNMPDFTEPSNLYVDKQRNLWLGKENKGVLKLTFKSNHFSLTSPDPADLYSNANRAHGLCTDRQGRLWMGTQDSTIHLYDARTRRFLGYFSPDGSITPRKTCVGRVNVIMEDHAGNVWIGTRERGLLKAIPQDARRQRYNVECFAHSGNDAASLSDNHVTALLEDDTHRIWVGTADGLMELVIIVQENQNKDIRFGLNFSGSVYESPIQLFVQWNDNNFLGKGYGFGVSTNLSTTTQNLTLSFSDSWLGGERVYLGGYVGFEHSTRGRILQDLRSPSDTGVPDPYEGYYVYKYDVYEGDTVIHRAGEVYGGVPTRDEIDEYDLVTD